MIYDERFQLQASAEANYLTVALDTDAAYDEIALRMLTEDKPDFFLPISVKEINGRLMFRYKLINAVALKYAVDSAMTKKQYLRLALDLLIPFIKCKEWFFDYHYICIEPQYILRDKSSGKFLFAYLPERSLRNTDEEIIAFVESVLNYIDITDDKDFQIRMMHYFRSGLVSLSELYRMLMTERERIMDGGASVQSEIPPITNTAPVQSGSAGVTSAGGSAVDLNRQQGSMNGGVIASASSPEKNEIVQNEIKEKEPEKKSFLDMLGISTGTKPAAKNETKQQTKTAKSGDVLGGLFGGAASDSGAASSGMASDSGAGTSGDSVMEGLFGSSSSKKETAKTEKASDPFAGLFGAKKEPAEKQQQSGGGLFGMLGVTPKTAEQKPAEQKAAEPQRTAEVGSAPVGSYQPVGVASVSSDSPTFIGGGDRTMIDDLNAGAKYLELIDQQYSDCPREISLDFNKPYLVVGRRSNDPVAPDVAFPEQYKGVSRQHARITRAANGTISITDLGSTYGTAINGQRLVPNAEYPLTDGAILTFVESKPIRYRVHL